MDTIDHLIHPWNLTWILIYGDDKLKKIVYELLNQRFIIKINKYQY